MAMYKYIANIPVARLQPGPQPILSHLMGSGLPSHQNNLESCKKICIKIFYKNSQPEIHCLTSIIAYTIFCKNVVHLLHINCPKFSLADHLSHFHIYRFLACLNMNLCILKQISTRHGIMMHSRHLVPYHWVI